MMNEQDEIVAIEKLARAREKILEQLSKVIVGQKNVINELLIALFSRGHVLVVGVPGLAKTLIIKTIARILALSFNRIQFTPDLMPSDITGTDIVEEDRETGKRVFKFIEGPIFSNIILADEINRTPPKTQAALLQSMQECNVTVNGKTYNLPLPFFVLATQNPIEQEGTYPLPEAQLDRFMFNIFIDYPSFEEEVEIVKTTTSAYEADLSPVLTGQEIIELQDLVRRVPVATDVVAYAVRLASSSRPGPHAPKFITDWVTWGAGPRASQYLVLGAKARAILDGRFAATREDIRAVALPVLRHRIVTNFQAEAENITSSEIIRRLLEKIKE